LETIFFDRLFIRSVLNSELLSLSL